MDLLSLAMAVTLTAPAQLPPTAPNAPVGIGSTGYGGQVLAQPGVTQPTTAPMTALPTSPASSPFYDQTTIPTLSSDSTTPASTVRERRLFESDHAFDNFINPVSNPVLAKDPRSSTWARVLFINNNFPGSTPIGGGDAQIYAMQVNLAITDRLTFIADKDGYGVFRTTNLKPSNGWLDLAAGFKYTLIRDVENQFLFTVGIMYEMPSGAAQVFQRTGEGIFTPFITYGKQFADHWHFMGTHGYSFGVDPGANSSFFYHSLHLDREINGWFYPLVEMNFFQYTHGGNALPRAIGEGDGLLNLGTQGMNGRDLLTTAIGAKFKLSQNVMAGAAYEFPLSGYMGILNNRVTVDLVLRY